MSDVYTFFFFFQAEDGIRDSSVTGVQTCALPISEELRRALRLDPLLAATHRHLGFALVAMGRFGEAVQSWDQWERLARSPEEEAHQPDVQRAREAARVFSNG